MAALTQLQEEPVQPFRHSHLEMGTRGVRKQLPGGFAQVTKSSGIPRCVAVGCGKCWTYRVGLRLVEPAVSGAEQAERHLGVGPHLGQAGQGLTHLKGWRSMWEDACRKPPPSTNPNQPQRPGWHQSCWHISEATTALDPSPSVEEQSSQEMGPALTWPSLK